MAPVPTPGPLRGTELEVVMYEEPARPIEEPSVRAGRRRQLDRSVLAVVALGGALGAPARYGVAQLVHVAPNTFPWATFATNVSGSLALGLVLAVVLERLPPTRLVRPFLATGFLGAYTTYSTFAVEADLLVKHGHEAIAGTYTVASIAAGLVAVWIGLWAGRLRLTKE